MSSVPFFISQSQTHDKENNHNHSTEDRATHWLYPLHNRRRIMIGVILALGTLVTGMYILLQSNPRFKVAKQSVVGVGAKRDRMKETKQLVLGLDDDRRYKFPLKGLTPGRAFQDLVIDNSNVPLVLIGEDTKHDRFGIYKVKYELPTFDNWTRLKRHLVPLQTYLKLDYEPTLTVVNHRLLLTLKMTAPEPLWRDLTTYIREDLNDGVDTVTPYLVRFQRFRITGGSEAGKSPTAKNIALGLADKYNVTPILSNPQSYSNKNYWGNRFQVEAKTHPEQYDLILHVAGEVMDRGTKEGVKPFKVYVFDELDSTVAFLDVKEQRKLKAAILMIIKQASHQNICCLFLGQTSAANLIPGTTKSDWMSLVTVAIGNTGFDAIAKSPALTAKKRNELVERYEMLLRKADKANSSNPNKGKWIRPAVVFDPSSVELVILPAFSWVGRYLCTNRWPRVGRHPYRYITVDVVIAEHSP